MYQCRRAEKYFVLRILYRFVQATKSNNVIVIGKIKCDCNLIEIDINVIDPCLLLMDMATCIRISEKYYANNLQTYAEYIE